MNVLFFGKSDRRLEQWARRHAAFLADSGGRVTFVAPYGTSFVDGNFEFVSTKSIPRVHGLQAIQDRMGRSIWRALACDRTLTDYTSQRRYACYSRYDSEEIEELVTEVGNALLQILPTVDYCIEGLFDNFVAPLAWALARDHGVPLYSIRLWHYWDKGFHIVDGDGYTSSLVDRDYDRFYRQADEREFSRIRQSLVDAKFRIGAFDSEGWRLRAQIVSDRLRSYEKPSVRNWIWRKVARTAGSLWSRLQPKIRMSDVPDQYLVFALHVMPEASILGTDPQYADQVSLVRRLSLNLPAGMRLLCKVHPGDRFGVQINLAAAQSLAAIANVELVDERVGIKEFLEDPRCLGIVTINGSVAIEAVMAGKACFLYGKGIFGGASCFLRPTSDDEFFEYVRMLARGGYVPDERGLCSMIQALQANLIQGTRSLARPGTWLDFYSSLLPAIHEFHLRQQSSLTAPVGLASRDDCPRAGNPGRTAEGRL